MAKKTGIRALDHGVEEFAKSLDLAVDIVMRRLTLDAWGRLTKRTPVDTGRARASWGISQAELPGGPPIPPGEHAAPTDPDVSGIDGKSMVFVSSNLVYMERLENGHSKQAPKGMVRITVAEIAAEIDVILAELNDDVQE